MIGKFQVEVNHSHFQTIRSLCLNRAGPTLKKGIQETHDIISLLDLLASNNIYFNWMNIKYLETIATAIYAVSGNNKFEVLVQNYKDAIFSRTLNQVWGDIPSYHQVRSKYFAKIRAVFCDKDPNSVTVNEVLTQCKPCLIKSIALDIMLIEEGSLSISWLISSDKVYQAFLSLLTVPQERRQDDFLQVGAWVVYHPQVVLVEQRKLYS